MNTTGLGSMLNEGMFDPEEDRAPAPRDPASPVRVFLIEDHEVVREGTRRLLEMDGAVKIVGEAGSGEDAISSPSLGLAEVVMCDIMLPGIDGIETTRKVMERYSHLRVVILSSFGDTYLGPALEAGAAGYLLKRATQDELVKAVKDAASGGSPLSPALNALLVHRYRELQQNKSDSTGLTERQREVLKMVGEGDTTKQIAAALFLSPATVKRELRHIFDVLGVGNRAHAVAEAQRRSLV
ncbi:MAG: response regulator transcription factor [Dehalococcoidia bacterium]